MDFLDRKEETKRLANIVKSGQGGFAVIWGRRRVGKTRLLLEWIEKHKGLYWVASESAATVQRKLFSQTLSRVLPGFEEVEYADWESLFRRMVRDLEKSTWRGPLVIDEFPYLVVSSKELPSILQQFIDHDFKRLKLTLAIAGSSQRMMQGLVLEAQAPLYGRAKELMRINPIPLPYIGEALKIKNACRIIEAYSIWGGIPRYWELAESFGDKIEEAVEELVLNPLGPLHQEPKRLLLEEMPSMMVLKPVLDVIGMGAHRVTEIATRLGQPITSLNYPLMRLKEMDIIEREIPFGESEKSSKKALYKIADPFFRFWFDVAGNKLSFLANSDRKSRLLVLKQSWTEIVAQEWEHLCRLAVPHLVNSFFRNRDLVLMPARRLWRKQGPEWDIVSQSLDKKVVVFGEVKWCTNQVTRNKVQAIFYELQAKGVPPLQEIHGARVHYCVFVPEKPKEKLDLPETHKLFDAEDVIKAFLVS